MMDYEKNELERTLAKLKEAERAFDKFVQGSVDAEEQEAARADLDRMLQDWQMETYNDWIEECLEEIEAEQQKKVTVAAASGDEEDRWSRRHNFNKSFHLENREEDIQVDIDWVDKETLEVIIESDTKEKLKALEVLSEDGIRTELGKIEENTYANINLVKLQGKLVISTEDDKLIELKIK